MIIDSPVVVLHGSSFRVNISQQIFTSQYWKEYKLSNNYIRAVKISPSSYVIRGFALGGHDACLWKEHLYNHKLLLNDTVFDKRGDAGISTDGLLFFDTLTSTLVYFHFYANKILYLDTNLTLIRTGRTIDTYSNYQVIAKGLRDGKRTKYSMATAPRRVNYYGCINNGCLYINSALKADNESTGSHNDSSVIDIYNIRDAAYLGSFYIPKSSGKRVKDFRFINKRLYVTYHSKLVIYEPDDAIVDPLGVKQKPYL